METVETLKNVVHQLTQVIDELTEAMPDKPITAQVSGGIESVFASVAAAQDAIVPCTNELKQKLVSFLIKSRNEDGYEYRSTGAIAKALDISVDKARELCSNHSEVRRNRGASESWTFR